jgi:hypothetical protein
MLQKMVCHRSPQPPSPTVLSENQMPEGQQDSEPKAVAIQTDKPKTLVRPGRSGAGSGVAQVAAMRDNWRNELQYQKIKLPAIGVQKPD